MKRKTQKTYLACLTRVSWGEGGGGRGGEDKPSQEFGASQLAHSICERELTRGIDDIDDRRLDSDQCIIPTIQQLME